MGIRVAFLARIYARLQLLHLRAHLEYEADFWMGMVGLGLTHAAGFVFVWSLFSTLPSVGGWTLWEVALLYGIATIPRGLVDLVANGTWTLPSQVNTGQFDRVLLRPVSPVLQVVTQSFGIQGSGTVLLGVFVLGRSMSELQVAWRLAEWALLAATLLGSTILLSAINLATSSVVFWTTAPTSSFPFLVQNLAEFAKFPLTLYGRFVQILLTWVLPFGLVAYYPSMVLLGRPEADLRLGWLAPLAGPVTALLVSLLWRRALARYQSVGH